MPRPYSAEKSPLSTLNSCSASIDGSVMVVISGDIDIDVGTVAITGDHAIGIYAVGYGAVEVKVDELRIDVDIARAEESAIDRG